VLRAPFHHAYARLGQRYPRAALAAIFPLAFLVVAGAILLLTLYVDIGLAQFWRILGVSEALVAVEVLGALAVASRLVAPADPWLAGERIPQTALTAWRALAGLPVDLMLFWRGVPVLLNTIPISIYVTLELDGSFLSFLAIAAGAGSSSPTACSCASSSSSSPCGRC
jgi:adenylate cyclase